MVRDVEAERELLRLVIQSSCGARERALVAYVAGQPDIAVVGHTDTANGIYALCSLYQPDVILVVVNGLSLDVAQRLQQLRADLTATELVVVYTYVTAQALGVAVRGGLTRLVPWAAGREAVLRALRGRARPNGGSAAQRLVLTDRELSIVTLLGSGLCVSEISDLLRISPHTVENHKRSIYAKFGVGNQSHAVSRAISMGLFDQAHVAPRPAGPPPRIPQPTPRYVEQDATTLAVVHGPVGPCLDQVMMALIGCGMPFVRIHTLHSVPDDHWAQWHRGPLATLLVDPAAEEWRLASDLGLPTVVVHSVPDLQAAVDAVLHGAYALVWQNDVPSDLASVLALVAHGYRALSAAYIGYLAEWMSKLIGRPESDVPELTAREQDILRSIARGHTVRQTARSLGIAAKTVENTQTRLFRKLGTRSRSETLTAAYRMGLLELKIGQPTRDARSG